MTKRAMKPAVVVTMQLPPAAMSRLEQSIKTNWANTIDTPPFKSYAVTCVITFTFGGLRIDGDARVINTNGLPIGGLDAAGVLVG